MDIEWMMHPERPVQPDQEPNVDELTGLPTRGQFQKDLKLAADQNSGNFAIILLDLDGLKEANDTLGHEAGDKLLYEAAASMQVIQDTRAYRLGGDEFVILANNVSTEEELEAVKTLTHLQLDNDKIHASLGGVIHSPEIDESELLHKADIKMYEEKMRKKYESYSPEQIETIMHIGTLAAEHGVRLRDVPGVLAVADKFNNLELK
jgi:diguanylate cyclase (GGDEF)-like protein